MATNQFNTGGYGYNPPDPRAQFMTSERQINATTDPIFTKPYGASDAGVGSVAGAMPGYAGGFLGNQSASFLGGAGGPNVAGNANSPLSANQAWSNYATTNSANQAKDPQAFALGQNKAYEAAQLANMSPEQLAGFQANQQNNVFGSYTPPTAQSTLGQMGVSNNAAMMRGLSDYQAGDMGMPGASGQNDYESKLAGLRQQSELATAADNARKAAAARPFDTMQSTGMYSSDPLTDMSRRLETYGSLDPTQQYFLQNQMQGMNQDQIGQLTQSLQPQQSQQQYQPQQNNNQNPYLQPFQQTAAYGQSVNQNWGGQVQNTYQNQQRQSQGFQRPQQSQQGLLQRFQGQQQQTPQGNRYGLLSAYGAR